MEKFISEVVNAICKCNSHDGSARANIIDINGKYEIQIISTDKRDVSLGYRVQTVLDGIFNSSFLCKASVTIERTP